jgi:ABC-type glycerol-3-phosphate transport system substrate-binding protein
VCESVTTNPGRDYRRLVAPRLSVNGMFGGNSSPSGRLICAGCALQAPFESVACDRRRLWASVLCAVALVVCAGCARTDPHVLTFAGSAVGKEGEAIRKQLDQFQALHPELRVEVQPTPDAANHRHQLYVQWLNARAADPDVLQLDVVWTPEFAAAGWILSLDRFHPRTDDFFPVTLAANRWNGALFALPWFVDAGMLYWRTDVMPHAPIDVDDLRRLAARGMREHRIPFGFVWQGARYEGLVTVFLEQLGAFGGAILDDAGRVVVDSDRAVAALVEMRDSIYVDEIVPASVLTWQEEQARLAFQNGQAVFMRNWPYAYSLLQHPAQSRVAGRFAIAPIPATRTGSPTAALGGSVLAINANSGDADAAYRLIEFLLAPAQLLDRARVAGEYPPRPTMYEGTGLGDALQLDATEARRVIESAVARPVTPVYNELSQLLQIALHRALTRQQEPRAALQQAATAMRALLARTELNRARP